jgi:azurin
MPKRSRFLFFTLLGAAVLPLPAAAQAIDTVTVEINAVPGIRFDRVRFQAPPGAPVKIVFENRDDVADMDHNLVITRPGARMEVVLAGMGAGVENNYVPSIPQVLAFTPQLERGQNYVLTFTAPTEAGAYPYVCTFPGHGYVMYGVMYVGQEMPALASDENVPPAQRTGPEAPVVAGGGQPGAPGGRPAGGPGGGPGGGGRPAGPDAIGPALSFGTTFPAVSRTFMPESGPASIAVGFEDGQSYNFDAGEGFLRYAWSGGFVDNWPHWRGNGNAYATVHGDVFYRGSIGVPLRFGDRTEAGDVEFRGYSLDENRIPEFRYSLDGAEIRERIAPRPGGGLVRTFRIESAEPVRLITEPGSGVTYEASAGRWQDSVLVLTPAQAREFTLTMIPSAGGPR